MTLRKMKLLIKHINPTSGSHNASIIFLHGSGEFSVTLLTIRLNNSIR